MSEAGRALGLSRTSLLAAEEAGLLASVRTPGGHRRYRPAELRRYLRAAGRGRRRPGRRWAPATRSSTRRAARSTRLRHAASPSTRAERSLALDLATAPARGGPARRAGAGRRMRRACTCCQDGALRFCAASGVPRWLAERLAAAEAPRAVAAARDAARPQRFDPAAAAFPEPRSTGEGVAAALRYGEQAVGVLFVVLPAEAPPSPAELRTVEACAELLALDVADRSRIAELERQWRRSQASPRPARPTSAGADHGAERARGCDSSSSSGRPGGKHQRGQVGARGAPAVEVVRAR